MRGRRATDSASSGCAGSAASVSSAPIAPTNCIVQTNSTVASPFLVRGAAFSFSILLTARRNLPRILPH